MQSPSSLIFLVLLGVWAAYFVQYWIRRRDHLSTARSVEQFTELVGRVSLKNLVRETTDMIERLCIEAALELTGDNRASAAEILGLSRQSLYLKLRRYGLGDLDGDGDSRGREDNGAD